MATVLILLLFSAGLILGLLFFGGLWLTLRWLPTVNYPALLVMASLLGRTLLVSVGLYYLMDDNGQRLLVALLGFVSARLLLTQVLRSAPLESA